MLAGGGVAATATAGEPRFEVSAVDTTDATLCVMIQHEIMSARPLDSPVRRIWWYPPAVSAGMVTVPLATPMEFAVNTPTWTGVEWIVAITVSPWVKPGP